MEGDAKLVMKGVDSEGKPMNWQIVNIIEEIRESVKKKTHVISILLGEKGEKYCSLLFFDNCLLSRGENIALYSSLCTIYVYIYISTFTSLSIKKYIHSK